MSKLWNHLGSFSQRLAGGKRELLSSDLFTLSWFLYLEAAPHQDKLEHQAGASLVALVKGLSVAKLELLGSGVVHVISVSLLRCFVHLASWSIKATYLGSFSQRLA